MRLWHWTCDHGRHGIGIDGQIDPGPAYCLVWLTSDKKATREDLGLTSTILDCDRMSFLYEVDTENAEPWIGSDARDRMDAGLVADLECGRRAECWWISLEAVRGRLVTPRIRRGDRRPLRRRA